MKIMRRRLERSMISPPRASRPETTRCLLLVRAIRTSFAKFACAAELVLRLNSPPACQDLVKRRLGKERGSPPIRPDPPVTGVEIIIAGEPWAPHTVVTTMPIPRLATPDSTFAFFREGYGFIGKHCRELRADAFRTRLVLRPVTCLMGEDAARLFYDGVHFDRRGAMPPTTLRLLQDKGSVQQLERDRHHLRKALFLDLLTGAEVERIVALFEERWRAEVPVWRRQGRIALHAAMMRLLCDVVCGWAGVPVPGKALQRRTQEMAAMIGAAGSIGPSVLRALMLRRRAERWARAAVQASRQRGGDNTPVDRIAQFRDADGRLLDPDSAAVELLNLVRPTVAVARFITFAACALHTYPETAFWLDEDAGTCLPFFVDEVRRFYPFFPVIGGRVRQDFVWQEHAFNHGDWVLLGLHATNHDPRLWDDPERFRPDRFAGRETTGNALAPQGAGDHAVDHRCPGEWFTRALIGKAVMLLGRLDYRVPKQDLTIPQNRFPTLPRSGFVLEVV